VFSLGAAYGTKQRSTRASRVVAGRSRAGPAGYGTKQRSTAASAAVAKGFLWASGLVAGRWAAAKPKWSFLTIPARTRKCLQANHLQNFWGEIVPLRV
jgi:hypothetical protein